MQLVSKRYFHIEEENLRILSRIIYNSKKLIWKREGKKDSSIRDGIETTKTSWLDGFE